MSRSTIGGDSQRCSRVVRQHTRTGDSGVHGGEGGVVSRRWHDRDRDCCGGCLSGRVGGGVGERVGSAVTGCWGVGVRTVGCNRNCSVARCSIRRNRQPATAVIRENACSNERSIGARRTAVVDRNRRDGEGYRCRRCLATGVGGGVSERVRSAVTGGWCVDVRAIGGNGQRTVRRCGVRGDGEAATCIIGQYRRRGQRRIRRCGSGVSNCGWRNGERDACGGCLPAGVGGGIGERVRAAVPANRGVGVGAVRCYRDGAVRCRGVRGDGQAGARVVAEHARSGERGIGRCRSCVVRRGRGDGDVDCRGGCLSAGVGGGIGERIRARVSGGGCVGVRAVCGNGDRAVGGRCVGRNREAAACVVGQDRGPDERRIHRGCTGVVGSNGSHRKADRRGSCLSAGVGGGVGEGVRAGVIRRGRIGVGAVRRDGHAAVGSGRIGRYGQAGAGVIGQHGGGRQRGVGIGRTGVASGRRGDGEADGGGSCPTGRVSCGVGE